MFVVFGFKFIGKVEKLEVVYLEFWEEVEDFCVLVIREELLLIIFGKEFENKLGVGLLELLKIVVLL